MPLKIRTLDHVRAEKGVAKPRLLYVVTEDWYFLRHRLPMAQAAQSAGFDVHVVTRLGAHRSDIEQLGFTVHGLEWSRRSLSPFETGGSINELRNLIRTLRPSIVHNIALKPTLLGSAASVGLRDVMLVNNINGLGSSFLARDLKGRLLKTLLRCLLPVLLNRTNSRTIVQNPEDRAALIALGVRATHVELIPGSGVDTELLQPLPMPHASPIRAAFVGRMLEDKGVRTLIDAHRLLRRQGVEMNILLAGTPDIENPTSISVTELEAWAREPGIEWAGHVDNIAEVWARTHIAVLPSRREGLPKSLLEAAACARPMIASDTPGCREIAIEGETGYLVPVDDAPALALALKRLAGQSELAVTFGHRARQLAVEKFSAKRIGELTVNLYARLSKPAAAVPHHES